MEVFFHMIWLNRVKQFVKELNRLKMFEHLLSKLNNEMLSHFEQTFSAYQTNLVKDHLNKSQSIQSRIHQVGSDSLAGKKRHVDNWKNQAFASWNPLLVQQLTL